MEASTRGGDASWLARAAAARPERAALVTPLETVTYAELELRAQRAARILTARGVGPGDRVAILLEPGIAFAEALHGCLRLGAVAVPIDLRLGEGERAVQLSGAASVVDDPLEGASADPPSARRSAADVAVVVHTSGTAGVPKAIGLTHANWEASARGSASRLGLHSDERWLCTLPLSHVGGLSILVRSAIHATTALVHERFEPERVAGALGRDGVTMVSLVPTTLARLLDAEVRPGPALRCVLVGGGPLADDLAVHAAQAGFPLAQTYGLTEACSQVTTSEIGDPSTAGRALDGTIVEIAPDGEILVAGPTVAPGAVAPDGRLHTGDLGRLDDAGRLTVTGRHSELIVTGAENVAPVEVEAVLESHPAVAEAAVHGRPDPEWGEAVVASVVLRPGRRAGPEELRAHCASRLAGFKVPKAIEVTASLPRTASGKLQRERLV